MRCRDLVIERDRVLTMGLLGMTEEKQGDIMKRGCLELLGLVSLVA
jgi:hypothetical protein